mgnify:CR=1 FL=1
MIYRMTGTDGVLLAAQLLLILAEFHRRRWNWVFGQ